MLSLTACMKDEPQPSQTDPNQHYWQELRQDKENGLYQLYQAAYDGFYRYGMLSVSDPHLVKSAINSTFTDLWIKRQQLPEVDQVKAYLFICFKRQLFQLIRKESADLDRKDTLPQVLLTEASFEEALVGHELDALRKARIRKALAVLSARQRQFIQQRFFEDLSYEEIAELSTTSVRTVYNTIHSAINRLRQELGDTEWILLLLAWYYRS